MPEGWQVVRPGAPDPPVPHRPWERTTCNPARGTISPWAPLTILFAVWGCCCKEAQSQMGLFCGLSFVDLWTMHAMLWYPSTGGPFRYHT